MIKKIEINEKIIEKILKYRKNWKKWKIIEKM